jgi:hypothetical protein
MSDPRMAAEPTTFFDLYLLGQAQEEAIDAWVERWHDLADQAGPPLHALLGLTAAEYALWVYDPGVLPTVRMARLSGQSLADVVSNRLAELDHEMSPEDDTRRNGLRLWLAQQAREIAPA